MSIEYAKRFPREPFWDENNNLATNTICFAPWGDDNVLPDDSLIPTWSHQVHARGLTSNALYYEAGIFVEHNSTYYRCNTRHKGESGVEEPGISAFWTLCTRNTTINGETKNRQSSFPYNPDRSPRLDFYPLKTAIPCSYNYKAILITGKYSLSMVPMGFHFKDTSYQTFNGKNLDIEGQGRAILNLVNDFFTKGNTSGPPSYRFNQIIFDEYEIRTESHIDYSTECTFFTYNTRNRSRVGEIIGCKFLHGSYSSTFRGINSSKLIDNIAKEKLELLFTISNLGTSGVNPSITNNINIGPINVTDGYAGERLAYNNLIDDTEANNYNLTPEFNLHPFDFTFKVNTPFFRIRPDLQNIGNAEYGIPIYSTHVQSYQDANNNTQTQQIMGHPSVPMLNVTKDNGFITDIITTVSGSLYDLKKIYLIGYHELNPNALSIDLQGRLTPDTNHNCPVKSDIDLTPGCWFYPYDIDGFELDKIFIPFNTDINFDSKGRLPDQWDFDPEDIDLTNKVYFNSFRLEFIYPNGGGQGFKGVSVVPRMQDIEDILINDLEGDLQNITVSNFTLKDTLDEQLSLPIVFNQSYPLGYFYGWSKNDLKASFSITGDTPAGLVVTQDFEDVNILPNPMFSSILNQYAFQPSILNQPDINIDLTNYFQTKEELLDILNRVQQANNGISALNRELFVGYLSVSQNNPIDLQIASVVNDLVSLGFLITNIEFARELIIPIDGGDTNLNFDGSGSVFIDYNDGTGIEERSLPLSISPSFPINQSRIISILFNNPSTVRNIDLSNSNLSIPPKLDAFQNLETVNLRGNDFTESMLDTLFQDLLNGKDDLEVDLMGVTPSANAVSVITDLKNNKNVTIFAFRLEAILNTI